MSRVFVTGSADGLGLLAARLLTALIVRPDRLVYLSSGMHRGGTPDVADAQWTRRRWSGSQAYSDSKLYDTVLAFAVARRWPAAYPDGAHPGGVRSNSVDPGWVPTKMGGRGAPDDLAQAPTTQVWLAVGDDATATGEHWFHRRPGGVHPATRDPALQDAFLAYCADLSGVTLPDQPGLPVRR